jgi:quercetin dioxygenase-like cupin family protein
MSGAFALTASGARSNLMWAGAIQYPKGGVMTRFSIFTLAVLTLLCSGPSNLAPVIAQQGITRTPLSTTDFPGGYQIVMGIAQIPANTCFDRHTHPGVESAYILEGEVLLKIEGSPEKDTKAGTGVQIPAVAPHSGCTMAAGAKVLTVHVVEKGKPLASPAP